MFYVGSRKLCIIFYILFVAVIYCFLIIFLIILDLFMFKSCFLLLITIY